MRASVIALGVAVAAVAACYVGPPDGPATSVAPSEPGAASPGASQGAGGGGAGTAAATGVPCEIAELLASRCVSCHGAKPSAPMALVTYEDLVAAAKSDPSKKVAELALARMKDTSRPMPPSGGQASPAELAVFEAWVTAGMPRGACDAGASVVVPPEGPPVCTSGRTWSSGRKGATMEPGRACISCHRTEGDEGPIVQLGGTVYPTLREPDRCLGVDGSQEDVRVVVTDAAGRVITMPVNASGNFAWLTSQARVTFPIRAKVVSGGKERAMATPQTTGDCNSCHTVTGANGAPGRIYLP